MYIHHPLFTVDGVLPRGKQGFSNSTLLSFYTRSFLVSGAVLGFGAMFSSIPGPYPGNPYPYPRSTPSSSCDNQKGLQILPDCLQVGNWGPLCLYNQMCWLPSCYSNWVPLEASQVVLVVTNLSANADARDLGLIPGLGRYPGGGNGDPL